MIYGFLIQQVDSIKVERPKKRVSLLAKHGSSPTLLAPLMIVSRQVGKEIVDALRRHLRTFRRVELQTWKYCNYLLDFSATASTRRYSEGPYGSNCEVQVELFTAQDEPITMSLEEFRFQFGFVIQILLHCHKGYLLDQDNGQSGNPKYSLSVLYKSSGTTNNSEINNATLKCTFEGKGSVVYSTSIDGSIASRMIENINIILTATNSLDTAL